MQSKICSLLFLMLISMFVACGQAELAPSEVYLNYHARSAQGLSFEEESSFFSARQVASIDEKIASMEEQTGRSRDELTELYLDMSRDSAKCSSLSLVKERIEGDAAFLVFDATNSCPDESISDARHEVKLVREDGWKLDEVEIIF